MSARRTVVLDIRELIRQLQAGQSARQIAKNMHLSRVTVGKYRTWAVAHELLSGTLPSAEALAELLAQDQALHPAVPTISSVEPYRAVVVDLRQRGLEMMAVFQRLRDEHGYTGAYSSVRRFVQVLEPAQPDATIRIERQPGEEVQVDFGYAGLMIDAAGQVRRAWAFVMTLAYSRHQYVEFVFDQSVETWLLCHQHAFEYFGGVPRKVVLDNLKAGIVQACFDEPQVQRAYRDCAEYYGFLIAPCRVREPQEKGKVESGVHYVARNFLAGREPAACSANNVKVRAWIEQIAGVRDHGSTHWQPLVQFKAVEQASLLALPVTPFEIATWKHAKLHRDCYVQFDKAYYSAPVRYIGQTLWVRGDAQTVRIFAEYTLLATFPRATRPGQRQTNLDHLPIAKADALTLTPERCQAEAAQIGVATQQVVQQLLDERPLDRLRTARKVLRLTDTYPPDRLEQACARALHFDTANYRSIKQILLKGLEAEDPRAAPAPESAPPLFARTAQELLAGGA
jgi:transposase